MQCGRPTFDAWIRKMPWRRKWQPTPVILPGKSHEQRSLVGRSPWGRKELHMVEWLYTLLWLIILIGYWILNQPCKPGINPIGNVIQFCIHCWEFLHLYSWKTLVCNLLFLSCLSLILFEVILASQNELSIVPSASSFWNRF